MRIALAQINTKIGDLAGNTEKIIDAIAKSRSKQAALVVFPELSLIGYPPEDLLESDALEHLQDRFLEEILPHCMGCDVILGGIVRNKEVTGKKYFNAAFFLSGGKIKQIVHKTLLPSYDVFAETRYFEPSHTFECIFSNQRKIAITICEDIWDEVAPFPYAISPLDKLAKQEPDLIINISASPFGIEKQAQREQVLRGKCLKHKIPAVYVNQVGGQTELLFDGASMVMNSAGKVVTKLPAFAESICIVNFADGKIKLTKRKEKELPLYGLISKALQVGVKDYFHKNGFKTAVLGSSGGIDSAVVQVIASQALGPENVTALLMPSAYSSEASVLDAKKLSETLGNPYHIVPIQSVTDSFFETMKGVYGETAFDLTEENIQSRSRGVIAMAFSNKKGCLLLNTSNKSELAVGYGTLYGDMSGALSVIGDLYKTHVYGLAHYLNETEELIPNTILIKEPSAELRPDQKDSDSLPPYALLDKMLYAMIEEGKSSFQLLSEGFDEALILRIKKLVQTSEYKRFQAPPVLKLTTKSFGKGRLIPLTAKYV
jgi:NAD+ synthase (glutamine-hydrolysing)